MVYLANFFRMTADPQFYRGHQIVSFNNKLWVVGGIRPDRSTSILSSVDGIHWIEESSAAEFGERAFFTLTHLNNRLIITGGANADNATMSDVWTSSNGSTWTREEYDLPAKLAGHIAVENEGYLTEPQRLIVFSGADLGTLETSSAAYSTVDFPLSTNLLEWRGYSEASVQLDVTVHTIEALNTADNSLINRAAVYDSERGILHIGGETTIQSVQSSCEGELQGASYVIDPVVSDCTVMVTYAPQTFDVAANAVGAGTISPEVSTVESGTVVSLTVTPASWWYVIESVEGCGGTLTTGTTYETAPIMENCSVTATFTPWWSRWFR